MRLVWTVLFWVGNRLRHLFDISEEEWEDWQW
jgi:hypothetical protein